MSAPSHRWQAAWCVVALALAPAAAQDELGLGKMWTFERRPLGYLEREYGFAPDEAWWSRMRLASLRFGTGCSASFVSAQGLILTNQHCVREYVAKVQGANDWLRDGFVAAEMGDEVRLPQLSVQQLVGMREVTAEVERGVGPEMDTAAAEAQRERNRERLLLAARQASPGLEPQLVPLFQGACWQLYSYRVFDDVRLVMTPHLQIAHFGGDPDNFVYPRYAVDFAFCRAYVDGKPADTTAHHFTWGDGPAAGDLVFLTGNPGTTQRMRTAAQLEFQREVYYPRVRELIDGRIAVLEAHAAKDAEADKRLRPSILRLENGRKLYRGEHAALLDPGFQARKAAAESAFRARATQAGFGAELVLWDELAALMEEKRAIDAPVNFQSAGGLPLLLRALATLEYAATGDALVAQKARDVDCRVDAVQVGLFVDHLARAQRRLPADDRFLTALLRGREPAAAAAALLEQSRLADAAVLEALLQGGREAIERSDDAALVAARVIRDLTATNEARRRMVEAAEAALGARLARLAFRVYGADVSPDATFTLRWSDGFVVGYDCNGTRAPWRTVFHGLYARSAEFDGQHPFDLPPEWLLAKDRIDMTAPVDFVCTVDSTGGNSGSPVVDRKLQLVGLLFDGNIESMANEFLYGERAERSICVHPQAIVEALRKVYRAPRLLRELSR